MTERYKDATVGVVMGGLSAERAVSLETGAGVLAALLRKGYNAIEIDWQQGTNLASLLGGHGVDVVWNALHGTYGEDGSVQGLLSCLQIPYTGSDVLSSAVAMDKVLSKRIFRAGSIPTPDWHVVEPTFSPEALEFDYPVVVKPAGEGSSVGVTIVTAEDKLMDAVSSAQKHRSPVLIEPFVAGREVCVGILDGRVLGSLEIKPSVEFYDYEAKYQRDDTEYSKLAGGIVADVEGAGFAAHLSLGCHGYSRVDLRVTPAGRPFVLEVNTLPGMTSHSLMPKIAGNAGIEYDDLCVAILQTARA